MSKKKEKFDLLEKKLEELEKKRKEIVELTKELATGVGEESLNLEERYRLLYFVEEKVKAVDENLFCDLFAIVSVL